MEIKHAPVDFSVSDTIRDIPKEDWDKLFGQTIESYGYQKSLEEASLDGFSFRYLLARRNDKTCAIIPFYVMDLSFSLLFQGWLRKLVLSLQKLNKSFMKFRVAFLGILTAEEFYAGISKEEDLEALFDAAIKELFRFCKKERIAAIIFNNLSADNSRISGLLEAKKFIKMEALPSTLIEIKARSLEEYISGLSKNMRKDLERKLKRSASLARLTTEVREDIDDISMDIHKLYLNNFGESQVHFEVLTEEFFRNIPKYMPGEAKYFVTYDKDRIVAFNLCLFKGSTCIDKFIGFDREVARKYHLYFTTFCHNIDWCIKNNIRFYCPGPTDYRPKVRLGARLVPLADYSKSHNPAYNFFLRLSAKFIKPENIDSSFGDIREPEY